MLNNKIQLMVKVAYQGERGAYSHQAILQFLGSEVSALPYKDFDSVFDSVALGKVDYGLVCCFIPILIVGSY